MYFTLALGLLCSMRLPMHESGGSCPGRHRHRRTAGCSRSRDCLPPAGQRTSQVVGLPGTKVSKLNKGYPAFVGNSGHLRFSGAFLSAAGLAGLAGSLAAATSVAALPQCFLAGAASHGGRHGHRQSHDDLGGVGEVITRSCSISGRNLSLPTAPQNRWARSRLPAQLLFPGKWSNPGVDLLVFKVRSKWASSGSEFVH